jgi:hypothetical protein
MQELVNSITVRNHIYNLVNGPRTALISKEEEGKLRQFASKLDREVVDKSIEMLADDAPKKPLATHKDVVMAQARDVKKQEKAAAVAKSAEVAAKDAEPVKPKTAADLLAGAQKKKGVFRRVDADS